MVAKLDVLARRAAFADLRDDREATAAQAAWWVGEYSHALGIVDAHGMIDLDGPIARAFVQAYRRVYRRYL